MSGPTPQRQLRAIVNTLTRLADETVDRNHVAALRTQAIAIALLADVIGPRVPSNALTPAQARVLSFIRQCISEYGVAPTRKEICEALSFASPNSAQEHIHALVRKGYITLTGAARGIRVNKRTSITTNKEISTCHSAE